jgi:hypothetical protein
VTRPIFLLWWLESQRFKETNSRRLRIHWQDGGDHVFSYLPHPPNPDVQSISNKGLQCLEVEVLSHITVKLRTKGPAIEVSWVDIQTEDVKTRVQHVPEMWLVASLHAQHAFPCKFLRRWKFRPICHHHVRSSGPYVNITLEVPAHMSSSR